MSNNPIGGISSGEYKETSKRMQPFHITRRNSMGNLTVDALTQANPSVVTTAANKSTRLANVTKVGVLSGSIAFTRPDAGNGFHGGPALISGSYSAAVQPLGFFQVDAVGNAFESSSGAASGKGSYICGTGSTIGLDLYETQQQIGGSTALTWAVGDKVYASVNGYATNRKADAYEYNVAGNPEPTVIGIVKVAPSADNTLLVIDLRI